MDGPLFTLCAAAAAGVILISASTRLRIPAIVLLLIGGVVLGPEGAGVVNPLSLGSGLKLVVGMAVAVILFEGGLTLDFREARRSFRVIGRILTIGVLVTWVGAALTIWLLFRPALSIAVLCGTLVVVTGPTVVAPILRRINVRDRIRHVLYWESVLVDAIGVFLAVLCFEWISPDANHGTWSPLLRFGLRVGVGVGLGVAVGLVMAWVLRSHLIHDEHVNIFVLGMAVFLYAGCESVLHESGVLAVIVAGFCLGAARPRQLRRLKRFKLELTELGVGTLFVLLAGTLQLEQFQTFGWPLVAAVAALMFIVRPVAIFVSTLGLGYSLQERAFLSWVAPRGIVAAFLASLFALELGANEAYRWEAQLIHTFTFAVIGATVILQGLSAPAAARLLRVGKKPRRTWLIVGEEPVVGPVVAALEAVGIPALGVAQGHGEDDGTTAGVIHADPRDPALADDQRFADVARVVALSPNIYFNELVCERWAEIVGHSQCFHWSDPADDPAESRFVGTPIWPHAGTPSALESKLESGSLVMGHVELTEGRTTIGEHAIPLFRVRGESADISAGTDEADWAAGDLIIVARQRVPGLAGLVRDAVIITTPEPTFETVVQSLLEQAHDAKDNLPIDDLHALIIERESSMPTAMGAGVAIPHAYHEAVEEPQCYLANVRSGMTAETPDGQPIRLVFLVLSPRGAAETHLRSLAAIAKLCSDRSYLALLEEQDSGDQLLQLIRERE